MSNKIQCFCVEKVKICTLSNNNDFRQEIYNAEEKDRVLNEMKKKAEESGSCFEVIKDIRQFPKVMERIGHLLDARNNRLFRVKEMEEDHKNKKFINPALKTKGVLKAKNKFITGKLFRKWCCSKVVSFKIFKWDFKVEVS